MCGVGGSICPQGQCYWLGVVRSKVIDEEAEVQSGQVTPRVTYLLARSGVRPDIRALSPLDDRVGSQSLVNTWCAQCGN